MGDWNGISDLEVEGVLGRGASSTVYLGRQGRFGRKVAVKVLNLSDDVLLDAFLRAEVVALGQFASHPNILTLLGEGLTADGQPFLITEYLPGGTLADRLRREGPLPSEEVLSIGVELSGALESTHLAGIVHGDVKPQNVLVGRLEQAVLADFGIARIMAATSGTLDALTPLHVAPELLEGSMPSVASDVYSLASTLFELVEGRPAVGDPGDPPLVVLRRLAAGERRTLVKDTVPSGLRELLEGSLDLDPDHRPASAREFGEKLRQVQLSSGREPSPLVVLDPSDPPGELSESVIDLRGGSAVQTIPPGGRPTRPAWGRAAAIGSALVLAVVAVLGAFLVFDGAGTDGADSPSERASPAEAKPEDASTTTTLPESPIPGVQPGIEVVEGGQDESVELAAALAEEEILFSSLRSAGVQVGPASTYGVMLQSLPSRFHYQAFNPLITSRGECSGAMTSKLEASALWERGATWDGGRFAMSVGKLAGEEQAEEFFNALSLAGGAHPEDCTASEGNAASGVSVEVDELDIMQSVLADTEFNSWLAEDVDAGSGVYPIGTRVLARRGPYLVDIILLVDETFPALVEHAMSDMLNQVVVRLSDWGDG